MLPEVVGSGEAVAGPEPRDGGHVGDLLQAADGVDDGRRPAPRLTVATTGGFAL